MRRLLNKVSLSLVVLLILVASLQAAEHRSVIIVVDPSSGLALIPDGTGIPHGINVLDRDGGPLVFAYAPESAFTKARALVAATAPRDREAGPAVINRERLDDATPAGKIPRFRAGADDSDDTYYVTFWDGSYISSRRIVQDLGVYGIYYGVITAAYTPENDWYSGTLYVEQSSSDKPGFNQTNFCSVDSTGGSCSTIPTYYGSDETFTAHVVSSGNIHHHRLPICGRYDEPPCNENFSGSIDIYFP